MKTPYDQELTTVARFENLGRAINEAFVGKHPELSFPDEEPSFLDQAIHFALCVAVVCATVLVAVGTVAAIWAMAFAVS
jgi:hypothetical protein